MFIKLFHDMGKGHLLGFFLISLPSAKFTISLTLSNIQKHEEGPCAIELSLDFQVSFRYMIEKSKKNDCGCIA